MQIEVGDFVRIIEPIDPRCGQVGTVTAAVKVDGDMLYSVVFPDGDRLGFEADEISPA